MHEVAVNCRHVVLDAHLLAAKYQLFEFAVCGNKCDRGRRLESNPAFGAEHRIAQMDTAANAVVARQCFEFFDQSDGLQRCAIQGNGNAPLKFQRVVGRWLRVGESAFADKTQADSGIEPSEVSVSLPPIVIPQRPRLIEYADPCEGRGRPCFSR